MYILEFLTELLVVIVTFSFFLGLISLFVLATVLQRKKNNANFQTKHNWKKITQYLWLTFIVSTVLFSFTSANTPEAKKEAAQSSSISIKRQSKRDSLKKERIEKKKSEKKEKELEKKTRAKNMKQNFEDYKNALTRFPSESKNAITKAYWDSNLGQTIIVLNDEALEGTDAQLKEIAHAAWKKTEEVYDEYSPMPDDVNYIVDINDSTGNQIATTSAFGSFKFEGE